MDLLQYLRQEIVHRASRYGLILTPEALDYLLFSVKNLDEVFRSLSRQGITFVRLEDIVGEKKEREDRRNEQEHSSPEIVGVLDGTTRCEPRFRVKLYVDPDDLYPVNWERERANILLNRLDKLGELIKGKGHVVPVEYSRALRSSEEKDILGLVFQVETTSAGRLIVRLEDQENSVDVYVPPEKELMKKVGLIAGDSVVALRVVSRKERLILRDVYFPGGVPTHIPCNLNILVVPDPWKNPIPSIDNVDAVVLLGNIVNVYATHDIKAAYRRMDEIIVGYEVPVFVVPGPLDAVRLVPPRPPLEEDLFPNASQSDNVHLLGSPALLRVNGVDVLLQDAHYWERARSPIFSVFRLLLSQPNISSFPYLSSRDYALLKKPPHYVLIPSGESYGRAVGLKTPYILNMAEGKVIGIA